MKTKSLITSLLLFFVYAVSYGQTDNANADSLLSDIQDNIYNAFVLSIDSSSPKPLDSIIKPLEDYNTKAKQPLVCYWIGYAYYYRVIYCMQVDDPKGYNESAKNGIAILESIKRKSSDDYALLSRIQGLAMRYAGMKAVLLSRTMNKNADKALELDPNNIRANFVIANNDYFTPKMYGGGKKAEKYFLKAISLPEKNVNNKYLPTWGKDESYEYLIRFYMDNDRIDDAKKYAKIAIEKYPNSYMIQQLYTKLFSDNSSLVL